MSIKWISPSGKSFDLSFVKEFEWSKKHIGEVKQNPSRSYGKKNNRVTYRTLNQSSDTFQDLGVSGLSIPLEICFSGDNFRSEAKEFEMALCEIGKSKLRLDDDPLITVNVLDYSGRKSKVKDVASIFYTVNFHETGPNKYPSSKTETKRQTEEKAEELNVENAETFETLSKEMDEEIFQNQYDSFLEAADEKLDLANDIQSGEILADVKAQATSSSAYTKSMQTSTLLRRGFYTFQSAKGSLNRASGLLSNLKTSSSSPLELQVNDVMAKNTIVAAAVSCVDVDIETRKEAVEVAEALQEMNQDWQVYIDEKQAEIETLADGFVQSVDTNQLVQSAASTILEKAYDLKIEKTIVLEEITNPIEIAYKYYPDDFAVNPDQTLEKVISTNNLRGEEFFEIEKGRKVVVYV